ncbi:hypothetical protein [Actinacidiphila soli]|uniref:hypothetical protein n=1 Tax=Actinacidiphila soli TaxID=2487275 RepID=UPI000FC9DD70|nr:hypothetical protein [Actinacidiphila soli]
MTCALFWPEEEFTKLLTQWPALEDAYGADHHEHTRRVEEILRRLSEEGEPHLGVVQGSVSDFEEFTREEALSPQDGDTRAEYAADLAARGQAQVGTYVDVDLADGFIPADVDDTFEQRLEMVTDTVARFAVSFAWLSGRVPGSRRVLPCRYHRHRPSHGVAAGLTVRGWAG